MDNKFFDEIELDTSHFIECFKQGKARIKGIKEWSKILEKTTKEEINQIVNNIRKSLKNIKSVSRKSENDICNCILALKSIGVYL